MIIRNSFKEELFEILERYLAIQRKMRLVETLEENLKLEVELRAIEAELLPYRKDERFHIVLEKFKKINGSIN